MFYRFAYVITIISDSVIHIVYFNVYANVQKCM